MHMGAPFCSEKSVLRLQSAFERLGSRPPTNDTGTRTTFVMTLEIEHAGGLCSESLGRCPQRILSDASLHELRVEVGRLRKMT